MVFGWILWSDETGEPFQRLGPRQWTGKAPKRPVTIYRSYGVAQNMAYRHGCQLKAVYLSDTERSAQ